MDRDRCEQITTRLLDMFWHAQHEHTEDEDAASDWENGGWCTGGKKKNSAERSLIPSFYLCLTDWGIINCACLKCILWHIVCMCLDIWIHETPP